jgi:hypothetical protein
MSREGWFWPRLTSIKSSINETIFGAEIEKNQVVGANIPIGRFILTDSNMVESA